VTLLEEKWSRIEEANMAAGWFGEWSTEERDEIDSLAAKLDREIQLYPVIHAWRTNKGSQLTFWCTYCKDHHVSRASYR
jgi:hypothetical protein